MNDRTDLLIKWAMDCYAQSKNPNWAYIAILIVRDNYPNIGSATLDQFTQFFNNFKTIQNENEVSNNLQADPGKGRNDIADIENKA